MRDDEPHNHGLRDNLPDEKKRERDEERFVALIHRVEPLDENDYTEGSLVAPISPKTVRSLTANSQVHRYAAVERPASPKHAA